MEEKSKNAALIGGMVLFWSIYHAVSKIIVGATGSAPLTGMLLRSAALVVLTVQIVSGGKFRSLFRQGRATILLISIGVFGFLLDLFANLGYAGGALSTGTALLKVDVLLANLTTVFLYKKKLYPSDWLGTLVMLGGVLMVLGIDFSHMSFNVTDLFFILSAMCVTTNAFLIKGVQRRYHVDTDVISYYNNFVVLLLFTFSAGMGGAIRSENLGTIPGFWPLVALGGIAQSCVYFFYYRNLKRHEVWVVSLYLLLIPVVSCFIGVAFLGETLTVYKVLGIFIVLLGAAVILLRDRINKCKGAV